ncbi:hypothetical protein [Propionivibrio sp.]|uniref:hypothetical protein n=1 Tax=Propionivibrio sp. TaxID=2212460 RepID=UPI003BF176FF
MQFGKLKFLASLLAIATALIGCSPTPQTVGEMAKKSIQDVLRVDPRFKDTGVEVVQVQLTEEGERQYKGIASIKHNGVMHDVPVNVVLDGLSIKWSTAPNAFSFIPPNRPPQ